MCYTLFLNSANGEWGTWSNWSECSTTCGQGEHKRIRFCDSPVPDNGGRECIGNASDFTPCNNTECPGEELYRGSYTGAPILLNLLTG